MSKTLPEETDAKTLEACGIDKNLAKRARAAAATSEEKYEAATNKAINIAVALGGSDLAPVHELSCSSTGDDWAMWPILPLI